MECGNEVGVEKIDAGWRRGEHRGEDLHHETYAEFRMRRKRG
jgi:hypothetical protein